MKEVLIIDTWFFLIILMFTCADFTVKIKQVGLVLTRSVFFRFDIFYFILWGFGGFWWNIRHFGKRLELKLEIKLNKLMSFTCSSLIY